MADLQVKTANICNITSSTLLRPNAGGSGTYIADNSISVHMTSDSRASGIYVFSLPEQGVINDKYTISFVPVCATNNVMLVVLYGATTQISFTSGNRYTLTITATAADNTVAFYGADSVEKTIIIKDIQIEKGETATAYRPYSATSWVHSLRKLTTSTDTLTTLPADLYADGNNATVGLKGNMSQSGTPTPSSPIQPSETGERTENLWNESYTGIMQDVITYLPLTVGDGDYTLSSTVTREGKAAVLFLLAGNVSTGATTVNNGVWNGQSRTVTAVNGYVTIGYRKYPTVNPENANSMLNAGSTAKPYEPYGYKIPISSASTTTPVYLGEVESIRKIRKQILTGTESVLYNGNEPSNRIMVVTLPTNETGTNTPSNVICTHFETKNTVAQTSSGGITMRSNGIDFVIGIGYDIINVDSDSSPVEVQNAFKAYLTAQYANGTPATVWYVLATPTTGIVNEPLRKIGNYADTVSGITIPTITGADSFDVQTTLKPSEVSLTYTGWHDATVKEWDGSDWK